MAELLPAALGWIDEKKRQALNTVKQALAEAQANPIESAVNALRGVGRGALQLGEMAATPMAPQARGVTDQILPSNGSAVGDIAEALGPPLKTGLKIAGGMATMIPAATEDLIRMVAAERRGLTPTQVWQETGATRIPGGGVATEVPDINAKLNLPAGKYAGAGPLGDVYDHPELYAKMPGAKDIPFMWRYSTAAEGKGGGFNPLLGSITAYGQTPEDIKDVLVHEGQHWVQKQADWSHGSSPASELEGILRDPQLAQDKARAIANVYGKYNNPDAQDLSRLIHGHADALLADSHGMPEDSTDYLSKLFYYHQGGEAQARATQERATMGLQDLAETHPEENYNVPPQSLIIKYLNSKLPVEGQP